MENDFLQSIKLEISRTVTLTAYERIAFHKILSISKSEAGAAILIRDLDKPGAIRKSAITELKDFSGETIADVFIKIFKESKDSYEIKAAFSYFEKNPAPELLPILHTYYKEHSSDNTYSYITNRIIHLIGKQAHSSKMSLDFLVSLAKNQEAPIKQRQTAITSLQACTDLSFYEQILEEGNEQLTGAVFNTISYIAQSEMDKYSADDNDMFTKTPDAEDNFLLNIRVLLSKMTSRYEHYTNETKNLYIKALLSCNHREYIVYIMKALTSDDVNLIDTTLFTILSKISKLNNPDKLFRSLISMPSLTYRDDAITELIFISYFKNLPDNRNSNLIRDKIYNYIIVMLDNFFENYRKNFMIPEIVEKDHLPEIQAVRKFILERLNPRLKRRLLKYLTTQDLELKTLILEISEIVAFINPEDENTFQFFLQTLNEEDTKAREITASRINDIDYEKKYLKHRIMRLCTIIGTLKIQEASTSLVKILNYVKNYFDDELYYAAALSLSHLNYPYMLGELEMVLQGEEEIHVKKHTLELLSQFSEHRALTIMLDYLKTNHRDKDPLLIDIAKIILKRDFLKDKVVNDTAKMIIEQGNNTELAAQAVLITGKTAIEKDILYMHELIMETDSNEIKEAAVRAIQMIADYNPGYKKKNLVPFYKGYMRDPSIRVRIFSCVFLLQIGDMGALSQLKDMMIIKNKSIQRDILLVLGSYITIELAFFLLSLIQQDYAIADDIVPLFNFLNDEDKKQLDYFITNLFKRQEGTRFDYNKKHMLEENEKYQSQLNQFTTNQKYVMRIEIPEMHNILSKYKTAELSIIKTDLIKAILAILSENDGEISCVIAGNIISFFETSPDCATAALAVQEFIRKHNAINAPENKVTSFLYIERLTITVSNGEILFLDDYDYLIIKNTGLKNRIFIKKDSADSLNMLFKTEQFPDSAINPNGTYVTYRELISPLNFNILVDEITNTIKQNKRQLQEKKQELDETVLKHKIYKTNAALEMYHSLDNIGKIIKKDLNEINKYTKKRATDRELIKTIEQMTADVYKRYNIEISKLKLE